MKKRTRKRLAIQKQDVKLLKKALKPPVCTGSFVASDGIKYIGEKNKTLWLVYEKSPQILSIEYDDYDLDYLGTKTYKISIPHLIVVCVDEVRNVKYYAFFANRSFSSFDDKVCVAFLPNVGDFGWCCWQTQRKQSVDLICSNIEENLAGCFNSDIDYHHFVYDYRQNLKLNGKELELPEYTTDGVEFLAEQTKKNPNFYKEAIWPEEETIRSYLRRAGEIV